MDKFRLNDAKPLVDCVMGRKKADTVILNGKWVCVQTGEVLPGTDVAITEGRIAYVGSDASHTIGADTKIIDAGGKYLVPGLLDGHMHVESGMLTITEFVRAVLPHGTTAMFVDPHEIANVFGMKGVKLMVDEAAIQPVHVFVQMPSCVPSAPGLETPGASLGPDEVKEAMKWPGIIGLGEMMNFPGVFLGDEKMHEEMAAARMTGKTIGGHYASPDLGLPFHGYAAGGAEDDHEGTRLEDAVVRARQGMKVMMRYGSAWHDVAAQVKAVTELGFSTRGFLLCTDDVHPETLITEGHMDRVIRHAIAEGLSPMKAIQMATINTADHFGVSREIGMIAPGRWADLLIVEDLEDFRPEVVIAKGIVAARDNGLKITLGKMDYPQWARQSVHLPRTITAQDFVIQADGDGDVTVNVIGVIENQAPTRHLKIRLPIVDGAINVNVEQDLLKIALVERHAGTGRIQTGLVQGFGFKDKCAVASTVAHDSHHLIVVGTDEGEMAKAVNEVASAGGGQVVVKNGEVIGKVELPIAGLMSDDNAWTVASKAGDVLEGFKKCGCSLNNPNMQLSLLALVVIPELRISDLGIVDVSEFKLISLIENRQYIMISR